MCLEAQPQINEQRVIQRKKSKPAPPRKVRLASHALSGRICSTERTPSKSEEESLAERRGQANGRRVPEAWGPSDQGRVTPADRRSGSPCDHAAGGEFDMDLVLSEQKTKQMEKEEHY